MPTLEMIGEFVVHDGSVHLQQMMRRFEGPAHLLFFDELMTDDLIDDRPSMADEMSNPSCCRLL
jgi:hypothetical protein